MPRQAGTPNARYISKRLRFAILERDRFTCQYCGSTAPSAVLVIDHVVPVASGGLAEYDNLIVACVECNQGKAAGELLETPEEIRNEQVAQAHDHYGLLKVLADVLFALNDIPMDQERVSEVLCGAWGELYEQCAEWQIDGGKRLLNRPGAPANPRMH